MKERSKQTKGRSTPFDRFGMRNGQKPTQYHPSPPAPMIVITTTTTTTKPNETMPVAKGLR